MGQTWSLTRPQELGTFKQFTNEGSSENVEIPEKAENRRPTDVKWLIGLGVFIVLLLPFMIYTLYYSDIERVVGNYDYCGNSCGKDNFRWPGISCSGEDYTYFPYLDSNGQCVRSCEQDTMLLWGKCLTDTKASSDFSEVFPEYRERYVTSNRFDKFVDPFVYLNSVKKEVVVSCILSIFVSMGMLLLFRYAVSFVVWGILLGCFTGLLILLVVFWNFYGSVSDRSSNEGLLLVGIIFTGFVLIMGLVLLWSRRKVRLVILLLTESAKAVFQMPGLTLLPIISGIVTMVFSAIFLLTTLYLLSAGILKKSWGDSYYFEKAPVMIFTMFYNAVVYLWLTQIVAGIQYMIVAGAVTKWYFTRDKLLLTSPILSSAWIALKYHLGTVVVGSLIITTIQATRIIILALCRHRIIRCIVLSCLRFLEEFFKFFTQNAYIVTAMHGEPFVCSGKRAARLIFQNISDIIAVNFIGDFVLGMAKLLVMLVALLLSVGVFSLSSGGIGGVENYWPFVIVGIFALLAAHLTLGIFDTTIDTLFICYCEDSLLNDGMAKPFFMSRNLVEFVEESKKVYAKKIDNNSHAVNH